MPSVKLAETASLRPPPAFLVAMHLENLTSWKKVSDSPRTTVPLECSSLSHSSNLYGPRTISSASPMPFAVPATVARNFPNTGFSLTASAGAASTPHVSAPMASASTIVVRLIPCSPCVRDAEGAAENASGANARSSARRSPTPERLSRSTAGTYHDHRLPGAATVVARTPCLPWDRRALGRLHGPDDQPIRRHARNALSELTQRRHHTCGRAAARRDRARRRAQHLGARPERITPTSSTRRA
jgi:hypothetical protein